MVFLSIIIPAFNSTQTLPKLLDSIKKERVKDVEIIVVDDGSKDKLKVKSEKLKVNIFLLKKNLGPAHARNFGAKKAKGEVLLFLDSDVVVLPGTLKEAVKIFKEDKYLVAATGVWDKKQNSKKFFPQFKALRDWSYWTYEKKADSYYYLFSTRIAAIRKDVFLQLGGFIENFRGADVEDIEFTYRLVKKYRIAFNENMRVHHEFEDFWPIAKKYFKRAYQWVEIFQNRKKFDPVATTGSEAVTTLSATGLVIGVGLLVVLRLVISNWSLVWEIGNWKLEIINLLTVICFLFFVLHLWGVRKFMALTYLEQGLIFMLKSFFVGIALYLFIFCGAMLGFLKSVITRS